tara:strand:+ start:2726 stop:2971 length:246 start_codon:yes stop_codon:yes gene_type:complete
MGDVISILDVHKRRERQQVRRNLDIAVAQIHIDARLVLFEAELVGDEPSIEAARAVVRHTNHLYDLRVSENPLRIDGTDND